MALMTSGMPPNPRKPWVVTQSSTVWSWEGNESLSRAIVRRIKGTLSAAAASSQSPTAGLATWLRNYLKI